MGIDAYTQCHRLGDAASSSQNMVVDITREVSITKSVMPHEIMVVDMTPGVSATDWVMAHERTWWWTFHLGSVLQSQWCLMKEHGSGHDTWSQCYRVSDASWEHGSRHDTWGQCYIVNDASWEDTVMDMTSGVSARDPVMCHERAWWWTWRTWHQCYRLSDALWGHSGGYDTWSHCYIVSDPSREDMVVNMRSGVSATDCDAGSLWEDMVVEMRFVYGICNVITVTGKEGYCRY